MTDDEAVLACQNGDRDAFRHVVERHKDVLFGTAVLMTGNRREAEEHVQEALLSAWRGIRGFQRERPIKPWLVRILVNVVISYRRKQAVPTVSIDESGELSDLVDIGESLEAQEERQMLRGALSRLSPDHRQVVVLRYFAELTVPEVARAIGAREGTVKSRLSRALEQLREQLSGMEVGNGA